MELSRRITGITGGGSDGWGLYYRAQALKAEGAEVTELNIGEHDIRTDPAILEAMHEAAKAGHTGYAAVPGITPLREEIAARAQERTGVPTKAANVMVTAGGQAGLFAAHSAVLDPGETGLYLDPHYTTYPGTIRSVGGLPHAVETRPRDAFQPRADEIAEAARATRARSLLINTPNNPTGTVYSRSTLEGIAQACEEADLWLISDEVYDSQVWEGRHLSTRALPGMEARTMVVGSMSKSHAMTGSRIGWIIAPEAAVTQLEQLAINTTYGVQGYIQRAALFALQQGTALEQKIAEPFRRRRAIALDLLAGQQAVTAIPPQGAMYMMLDIRATGMSGEEFALALLEEERIAVMPGESFGAAASGHIRVALTVEDARFADAFGRVLRFAAARAA
ncbi:aminotransferase class I/II-fold pyridoxal phosphate-dependent enzyme [Aquicoccus sp. SCR17]|nr:aminotransferase class I/II-fold pyridoxal phosphate-dependent enzyme [Carideicomes alvinocaridis]